MKIYYENHMGEKLNLMEWPVVILAPAVLFENEWSYMNASTAGISGFYKNVVEKDIELQIFADTQEEYTQTMSRFMEIVEKDLMYETPGRLWVDTYYLRGFIYASGYEEYEELFYAVEKKIKLVVPKLAWIKEKQIRFRYQDQTVDESGKGYPYSYPYDYRRSTGYDSSMENDGFADLDFILTIYGYADNPEIAIAGNTYRLNYTIQQNEYVTIDSAKRKITLVKQNGVVINLFRYRDSSRIFEKIPTGEVRVYWNGPFDYDILLLEERSEPIWT